MYWPGLQGCGKPPFLSSRQLQCLCLLFLNIFHGKLDCLKKREKSRREGFFQKRKHNYKPENIEHARGIQRSNIRHTRANLYGTKDFRPSIAIYSLQWNGTSNKATQNSTASTSTAARGCCSTCPFNIIPRGRATMAHAMSRSMVSICFPPGRTLTELIMLSIADSEWTFRCFVGCFARRRTLASNRDGIDSFCGVLKWHPIWSFHY